MFFDFSKVSEFVTVYHFITTVQCVETSPKHCMGLFGVEGKDPTTQSPKVVIYSMNRKHSKRSLTL